MTISPGASIHPSARLGHGVVVEYQQAAYRDDQLSTMVHSITSSGRGSRAAAMSPGNLRAPYGGGPHVVSAASCVERIEPPVAPGEQPRPPVRH